LTPVGAFAASPGPRGTFDMGGNVWQWTEAKEYGVDINGQPCVYLGLSGGNFTGDSGELASGAWCAYDPSNMTYSAGFRVASVPEPDSVVMLLTASFAAMVYWWRRRV